MTPIDLDKIKEAAGKATPGPWRVVTRPLGKNEFMPLNSPTDEFPDAIFAPHQHTEKYALGSRWDHGEKIVDCQWGSATARGQDDYAYIAACDPQTILSLVAVVEAALVIDAAFKQAGTQGVTMNWAPVAEALHPFSHINGEQP